MMYILTLFLFLQALLEQIQAEQDEITKQKLELVEDLIRQAQGLHTIKKYGEAIELLDHSVLTLKEGE